MENIANETRREEKLAYLLRSLLTLRNTYKNYPAEPSPTGREVGVK